MSLERDTLKWDYLKEWEPYLNVMQKIDMFFKVQGVAKNDFKNLLIGRKENYELKRDWKKHIKLSADGKNVIFVNDIPVKVIDQTTFLSFENPGVQE